MNKIKKLIIIYGLHLEKIEIHTDIGNTLKRLEEKLRAHQQNQIKLHSVTVWETEKNIVTKIRD